MSRCVSLLVLGVLTVVNAFASTPVDTLAFFNLNHYDGWTYSRPDFELNRDNISHLRIRLYKSSSGSDHTLTSPMLSCKGRDSIFVTVDYVTDLPNFVASKLPLTFTLINEDSTVVAQSVVQAEPSLVEQTIEARICLPPDVDKLSLNLAALKADANNNGAIRSVAVTTCSIDMKGDVNGDGAVDIADVNAVINLILSRGYLPRADVNGDGTIDIADVNAVINIILHLQA